MFLSRLFRKFFGTTRTGESVTISLGAGCSFTLPIEHAIKLRDVISIQIIHAQDEIDYSVDTSRVTNGDME